MTNSFQPLKAAALFLLAGIPGAPGFAQTNDSPRFEVASLKPLDGPTAPHATSMNMSHETLSFDAATLRQLLGFAYNIQRIRVEDGPEWMDTLEYQVVAKAASPDVTRDQMRAMLQTLLTERFQLVIRHVTKQLPTYILTVGKKGSKLKDAKDDEASEFTPVSTQDGGWLLTYRKKNLVGLVNTLANFLGSPVHDETGLTGVYDYTLTWTRAILSSQPDGPSSGQADTGVTLIKAVEEQLGLKLELKKAPLEVLIVDRAEKASGN